MLIRLIKGFVYFITSAAYWGGLAGAISKHYTREE
jgi:hypothetical protein